MEKPLEAGALVVAERAVLMNLAGAGGVGPAGEEGLMQALPWQSCSPSGSPGVGCVWTQCSSPSSLHSHSQGQGSSSWSGSLEEEERELELLLEDELELEELDDEELLLEDELEEDDELELLEEELEDGALLEESGSWGGKELLWKLEDDQLLEELDEEELELLEDDELEDDELEDDELEDDELEDDELEDDGALLEESGGSGAEELCQELEDELLEEEELELLLGLGSNSKESPPPAEELLDEFPSSSSWYRLTRVSTVSPSLPAGVFSASR